MWKFMRHLQIETGIHCQTVVDCQYIAYTRTISRHKVITNWVLVQSQNSYYDCSHSANGNLHLCWLRCQNEKHKTCMSCPQLTEAIWRRLSLERSSTAVRLSSAPRCFLVSVNVEYVVLTSLKIVRHHHRDPCYFSYCCSDATHNGALRQSRWESSRTQDLYGNDLTNARLVSALEMHTL